LRGVGIRQSPCRRVHDIDHFQLSVNLNTHQSEGGGYAVGGGGGVSVAAGDCGIVGGDGGVAASGASVPMPVELRAVLLLLLLAELVFQLAEAVRLLHGEAVEGLAPPRARGVFLVF
jgi:hypothetical protein